MIFDGVNFTFFNWCSSHRRKSRRTCGGAVQGVLCSVLKNSVLSSFAVRVNMEGP